MRGLEQNGVYHVLLSVRSGKDVLNSAIVEGKQGGFVFKGDHFETIKDIIDFYQVRKRPLVISGVPTTLETPVRRKAWELRHRMVTLGKELGAGSYGTVYKGTLQMERGKPMEPYYLVMELVSGGSVDNYLTKKGKKLDTAMVHKSTDIYAFGVTMYECFTLPYAIPYGDWPPNKVYEEVVNRGYRLEPPKMMPRMIADLMAECLGPEPERPSFKTVVVCLRSFMKNGNTNRGLGVF
ncbi:Tyrosine-protein kinase [Aphelenchoides fujianensis]|nr:Tyrosine-protein kinase [Aphelenchoides fujianensis]